LEAYLLVPPSLAKLIQRYLFQLLQLPAMLVVVLVLRALMPASSVRPVFWQYALIRPLYALLAER
jgi:hypothetical protein